MDDCQFCGKQFRVRPARAKWGRGKYCSPACQYAAIRAKPKAATPRVCIGCGAQFTRPNSIMRTRKGAGKYCTRACRDLYWLGPLNPNWQTGDKTNKRGSNWQSIRRRILARDKCCRHCGATGGLHVHHKTPFRLFADEAIANADDNLISLCPPCHRREDARWKWMSVDGGVICMPAGGYAWELARSRGLI